MNDVRFAIRSLAKSKLFTVVALASLALGIGANVAVFSLVNTIAFKPLPYADPGRLVDVSEWSATKLCAGCGVGTSYPTFVEWQRDARSFSAIGAYIERPFNVSGVEHPERIGGALVSSSVFGVLGVQPLLGRGFEPDDDRVGASPVVVLGHAVWTRRYGGDRRIVGQSIRLNGIAHTVIGVMPPRFSFPEFAGLWVPFIPNAVGSPRDQRDFDVVARLAPNATIAAADAEMKAIARRLEAENVEQKEWTARVTSLRTSFAGEEANLFGVLLGAVSFVLLIVCANLAGLLLARGAQRQREIAIRLALGATRRDLVRHLLAEAWVLSLAGAGLGFLLAQWGVDFAIRGFSSNVPAWIDFAIDWRVLTFSLGIAIATGLLFGLLPALRASSPDVHAVLKEGHVSIRRSRLRGMLVIGELALALILLAGAGDLMKSFLSISSRTTGIDDRGLLTGNIEFLDAKYQSKAEIGATATRLAERLSSIPGTEAVTLDHTEFIAGFGGADQTIRAEGVASIPPNTSPRFYHVITPGYLATLRLPLLAGRNIDERDRDGSERVALLNRRAADQLWPNQSPLGRRIKLGSADSLPWVTVVGIVGDVSDGPRQRNYAYVPFAQSPGGPATLYLRSANALGLVKAVRDAARDVDPDLPVLDLQTVEQQRHQTYSPYAVYAMSMAVFAGFAILLAAIGLYGVIAYNTAARTREIGVRMALGAQRRDVLALVGSHGARLVMVGIVVGIGGSFAVLRVIQSMLFGASPFDPAIFAVVSATLATVSLVAVWLPARRAATIDPLEALRSE